MPSNKIPNPVIGVAACVKPLVGAVFHGALEKYLNVIATAIRGVPMIIPSLDIGKLDLRFADTILGRIDGLLLTGSLSNVHPSHYGQQPVADNLRLDFQRDMTVLPMIRRAVELGVPILGICRGLQEMNVAYGGSLHQNIHSLEGMLDHRGQSVAEFGAKTAQAHALSFKDGGRLAAWIKDAGADITAISVNSLHTQGIAALGAQILPEAYAPDGTVEAITVSSASDFAFAVQWHPELDYADNIASRVVLERFRAASLARAKHRQLDAGRSAVERI